MEGSISSGKSAFRMDAVLFTLLGIGIGAFVNYKLRLKADAKFRADESNFKNELKQELTCIKEKNNVSAAKTETAEKESSSGFGGHGGGRRGGWRGGRMGFGYGYGYPFMVQPNCYQQDASGVSILAPCGGDFDLTV